MKRVPLLILSVVLLSAPLPSGAVDAAAGVFVVDHEMHPYYPSLIKWNKSGASFTEPSVCAGCHPKQFAEWTGSVHALAFQDPIYQAELNKGFKAVGHDVTRQCEGCHSPAGMATGEIAGPGLKDLSPLALAGVSCDICHSISSVTHDRTPSGEPENGSFVLTPGVETTAGTRLLKHGPRQPAEGCGGGFHDCVESPLHLRSDLCASCHQVYHYENHFPIESTYLEWKHSPYAQNGILCQDCHMVEIETFLRTADTLRKPAREEYRHYFNGANYLLFYLTEAAAKKAGNLALAENVKRKYEMAVARLKAAAELEIRPVYRDEALVEIKVRVRNIRAGHNLPTSLTNIREMWLEVVAKDASGRVVLQSGGLENPGVLVPDTRMFTSVGMGTDLHFAIDPWLVTGFASHETIPPRGFKDVYFGVSAVKKQGPVTVEARLRYRQADQKVAAKLFDHMPKDIDLQGTYGIKYAPSLPVIDMVVKQARFDSRKK